MTDEPTSVTDPEPFPPSRSPYRLIIRLGAFIILLATAYRFFGSGAFVDHPSVLRKIANVPPFMLTERSGKSVTNSDLAGKVWVADFVYTTCPGPCPLVTAGMGEIQKETAGDPNLRLVSFTVDPQTDTPPVLAAYADKFGADPKRWLFLTGPEKPLYELIQNGFYQAVEDNRGQPLQPGQFTVTHSTRLVLVDAEGIMRGFYDGLSQDSRDELLHAIKALEKEEGL